MAVHFMICIKFYPYLFTIHLYFCILSGHIFTFIKIISISVQKAIHSLAHKVNQNLPNLLEITSGLPFHSSPQSLTNIQSPGAKKGQNE